MAIKTGTKTAKFTKRGAADNSITGIDAFLSGKGAMGNLYSYKTCTVFLYGLNFETLRTYLSKNLKITGFSISFESKSYSATSSTAAKITFSIVSGFNTTVTYNGDVNTYTDIGGKTITVFNASKVEPHTKTFTETDISTDFLNWINSNLTSVLNGYTSNSFGIRLSNKYAVINSITVTLNYEYEEADAVKILVDTTKPSKILIDTQAVKAVYIDTTKVYG